MNMKKDIIIGKFRKSQKLQMFLQRAVKNIRLVFLCCTKAVAISIILTNPPNP